MGPVQHSHAFDLPKKVRALGLKHALSAKAKGGALIVIESANAAAIKTKDLVKRLDKIGAQNALIVDGAFDTNFSLSARNLVGIGLLPTAGLNVYDILRRDKLVLTTAAVKAIEERLS
jgi:large subunit ribosomal protein L4